MQVGFRGILPLTVAGDEGLLLLYLSTMYLKFPTKLNGFRAVAVRNMKKTLKGNEMFYQLQGATGQKCPKEAIL